MNRLRLLCLAAALGKTAIMATNARRFPVLATTSAGAGDVSVLVQVLR